MPNHFLPDLPGQLTAIQNAIDQMETESLYRATHTLKGSARHMGAQRLADLSSNLETLGRQGTTEGALELAIQLAQEAIQVKRFLHSETLALPQ
ncbi:MAG: Hpt domain-containing protein [Nitrospirales bacterium]